MFQEDFKYYKSRCPQPNLDNVVDFATITSKDTEDVFNININLANIGNHSECTDHGLKYLTKWKTYGFKNHPGLIVIENPFSNEGHRYWPARSLIEYSKSPHMNNLSIEDNTQLNGDWWKCCNDTTINSKLRDSLKKKLRWITFGYHYNWNSKTYNENEKSIFPEDLFNLCKYIMSVIGFKDFKSQAAIMNFYSDGDTLAGHTDHSELNKEAPLISISFGQSAVFLIGGESKDTKPTALFIKSGDIVILSGAARLCYHAVPKIVTCVEKPWNYEETATEQSIDNTIREWLLQKLHSTTAVDNYLSSFRINLNIRQVLPSYKNTL